MMKLSARSFLAAGLFLLASALAPVRADDTVDFTVPECTTAASGSYCDTTMNWHVDPGSLSVAIYVKQDQGPWQLMSCIGRNPYFGQSGSVPINWIWRQHRHEFRFKTQVGCGSNIPTSIAKFVEGKDITLPFLDAPAADNTVDYAYVYRQAPGGAYEWLYFQTEWYLKDYRTLPHWTATFTSAQLFTRRSAHILARMGFDGNASGYAFGSGDGGYSAFAAYPTQPYCVIRHYVYHPSSQQWGFQRFAEYYDRTVDSWMWSSGFGDAPYAPGQTELRVACGDGVPSYLDHSTWLVSLLANETTNFVFQRNYGVYEIGGYRPICNPANPPSICQQ